MSACEQIIKMLLRKYAYEFLDSDLRKHMVADIKTVLPTAENIVITFPDTPFLEADDDQISVTFFLPDTPETTMLLLALKL